MKPTAQHPVRSARQDGRGRACGEREMHLGACSAWVESSGTLAQSGGRRAWRIASGVLPHSSARAQASQLQSRLPRWLHAHTHLPESFGDFGLGAHAEWQLQGGAAGGVCTAGAIRQEANHQRASHGSEGLGVAGGSTHSRPAVGAFCVGVLFARFLKIE